MRLRRTRLEPADLAALQEADDLASRLLEKLNAAGDRIDIAHVHGAGSSAIQLIVASILQDELGFREEVVLTPQDGFVTLARPDFYYTIGDGNERRGIIAEVERGGTVTNNHDLKDMWKTHIAPDAQHLFLVVPRANWDASGHARERPFHRSSNRLMAFFGNSRREVDVISCHIFGYGRTTLG